MTHTEVRSRRTRAIKLLEYVRSVLLAEGERTGLLEHYRAALAAEHRTIEFTTASGRTCTACSPAAWMG